MLLDNHQQFHHTFFELHKLSGQHTIKKNIKKHITKQLCHTFLESYIDQEQNKIQKKHLLTAL